MDLSEEKGRKQSRWMQAAAGNPPPGCLPPTGTGGRLPRVCRPRSAGMKESGSGVGEGRDVADIKQLALEA